MTVSSALPQRLDSEHPLDSHPETRLDFDQVLLATRQRYDKPFLLIDTDIVRTKARRFKAAMPRVHPHYAVKANPHPDVLKTLIEEGVSFEIASIAELDLLLSLGVPADEIYYSNPMKSRAYVEYAAAKGAINVGLVRTLKNEIVQVAPRGRVNVVAPGWTATPMVAETLDDAMVQRATRTYALRKVATPEEVASAIVWVASPAAGHTTGELIPVSGGMEGRVIW